MCNQINVIKYFFRFEMFGYLSKATLLVPGKLHI